MTQSPTCLLLAADGLLLIHTLFIAFVVLGLLFIIIGLIREWRWVRNPWFRFIHLGAIGIVVLQAWLNVICPLTIWENNLREKAGEVTYAGSFIQHWLHKLIFYQAEAWVFTLCYTAFAALAVLAWCSGPPDIWGQSKNQSGTLHSGLDKD